MARALRLESPSRADPEGRRGRGPGRAERARPRRVPDRAPGVLGVAPEPAPRARRDRNGSQSGNVRAFSGAPRRGRKASAARENARGDVAAKDEDDERERVFVRALVSRVSRPKHVFPNRALARGHRVQDGHGHRVVDGEAQAEGTSADAASRAPSAPRLGLDPDATQGADRDVPPGSEERQSRQSATSESEERGDGEARGRAAHRDDKRSVVSEQTDARERRFRRSRRERRLRKKRDASILEPCARRRERHANAHRKRASRRFRPGGRRTPPGEPGACCLAPRQRARPGRFPDAPQRVRQKPQRVRRASSRRRRRRRTARSVRFTRKRTRKRLESRRADELPQTRGSRRDPKRVGRPGPVREHARGGPPRGAHDAQERRAPRASRASREPSREDEGREGPLRCVFTLKTLPRGAPERGSAVFVVQPRSFTFDHRDALAARAQVKHRHVSAFTQRLVRVFCHARTRAARAMVSSLLRATIDRRYLRRMCTIAT